MEILDSLHLVSIDLIDPIDLLSRRTVAHDVSRQLHLTLHIVPLVDLRLRLPLSSLSHCVSLLSSPALFGILSYLLS